MAVILREDSELPDDATVVIHGGTESAERFNNRALADYDDYRPLRADGYGYFALSVYAAVSGITTDRIKEVLPHGAIGETTAGELRHHFELLATTIVDDETGEPINAIQPGHFDVVLAEFRDPRLLVPDALVGDDASLEAFVRQLLAEPVETFCELFRPRRDKRTGTIRGGGER